MNWQVGSVHKFIGEFLYVGRAGKEICGYICVGYAEAERIERRVETTLNNLSESRPARTESLLILMEEG